MFFASAFNSVKYAPNYSFLIPGNKLQYLSTFVRYPKDRPEFTPGMFLRCVQLTHNINIAVAKQICLTLMPVLLQKFLISPDSAPSPVTKELKSFLHLLQFYPPLHDRPRSFCLFLAHVRSCPLSNQIWTWYYSCFPCFQCDSIYQIK